LERREATWQVYRTMHASRHLYHIKTLRTVLSELMYAEPDAWRAVGITRAALARYREADHRSITGLERAHLTDRQHMVGHIIDRDEPLSCLELFDYWRATDRVVIASRGENRSNTLGDWIAFDNADAEYFRRLGIGFSFRRDIEGELTRKLASQLSDSSRPT